MLFEIVYEEVEITSSFMLEKLQVPSSTLRSQRIPFKKNCFAMEIINYSTAHFCLFIVILTNYFIWNSEEFTGTWEFRRLGNLKFRELGNFGPWISGNLGASELGNFGTWELTLGCPTYIASIPSTIFILSLFSTPPPPPPPPDS